MSRKVKILLFFILSMPVFHSALKAQEDSTFQAMPLFQSDEILDIDLEADFKTVFSVTDDSTWFPAIIKLRDNNGLPVRMDILIRTRGITRREKDVCLFPPLRLKFPKKETKNTAFEGQRAIKLVTHCNKQSYYEQNTVLEYLIYKAYNVLTDSSFKVRPAMINYINTDKNADTLRKFAFFIEREKFLADRLQGVEIESEQIHPNKLNPYHTCLMDMFQYMIGNTDYSIYKLHNVILVSDPARSLAPYAVPYDFDWSGLVSAIYAEPHPYIGTKKVTVRVYRGFKKDPEIVFRTIDIFNAKKDELYHVFENSQYLDENERKKAIKYLDEFYEVIHDEKAVKREFFDRARIVHN